ncbi:MAG: sugar transferase [Desulfuromonadaceae bacterium]|nr:sugar transferase [Desulfuromonadaceae bacterium]
MLREQAKVFNRLSVFSDSCTVLCAFIVAYYLRSYFIGSDHNTLRENLWTISIIVPVWCFLLFHHHLYSSIRRLSYFDILAKLVNVHIFGGIAVTSIFYLLNYDFFRRGFFLLFIGTAFVFCVIEKCSLKFVLNRLRKKGFNSRNLLIVGSEKKAETFISLVKEHEDWGLKIVGFVQAQNAGAKEFMCGYPVLGQIGQLMDVCKSQTVDEVVFCLPRPKELTINVEEYLRDLEVLGITVRMVLGDYDVYKSRRELSLFHERIPILTFHSKAFDAQQLFYKRVLDIVGALVGLTINLVIFPFLYIAIKRDSPGPIFFSQERVGVNGRIFMCWKYRSMYIDAEERKKDLLDQNEMNGAIFKIENDPRITKVGHLLRKTSLDELPQFWNVLKGEMSLVGTRPPTPAEVAEYEDWHRKRIVIKPGITGMWQVNGRNQITDFDDIVRLDLKYIDHWSFWLDIKILLKTVKVVLFREGSC